MVDNSVVKEKDKLQIALRPAVELSYLTEQEQHDLYETMSTEDCTPSHVQAMKMRKFSEEGRLDLDVFFSIIQNGHIRITKNAVNGSVEGWSFQILDADRNTVDTVKSGADGYAYSQMAGGNIHAFYEKFVSFYRIVQTIDAKITNSKTVEEWIDQCDSSNPLTEADFENILIPFHTVVTPVCEEINRIFYLQNCGTFLKEMNFQNI